MNLDILSAEYYSDGLRRVARSSSSQDANWKPLGETIATDENTRRFTRRKNCRSTAMTRKGAKKTRSRSPSADEIKGRPRGRPRLDKDDQTAGEVGI